MRLAFAVLGEHLGGAELHALDLAGRMRARGHQVQVFLRRGAREIADRCALPAHEIQTYVELARAIEELRPQVLQHFNSLLAVAGVELARERPRSIEVVHANHARERDHRPLPTDVTDRVIAVSASAAAHDPRRGARVIWSGVDLDRLRPTPRSSGARILAVGRLVAGKRMAEVVEACARLEGKAWRLTIAGAGPERAAIEGRARALGVHAQVELLGVVEDVRALYAAHDVLLSASESEGFGLAIAEAAACGLPIVARRAGGVTELLTDGEDALLADDAPALGEQLARVVASPALASTLGRRARALAERALDAERMTDEYEATFRALAAPS